MKISRKELRKIIKSTLIQEQEERMQAAATQQRSQRPPGSLDVDRRAAAEQRQQAQTQEKSDEDVQWEKALQSVEDTITKFRDVVDSMERLRVTSTQNVNIEELERTLQNLRRDVERHVTPEA